MGCNINKGDKYDTRITNLRIPQLRVLGQPVCISSVLWVLGFAARLFL